METQFSPMPGYDEFKDKVKSLMNIELDAYKQQIHRRVHMLMQRWKCSNYEEYFEILKKDPEKRKEFLDYLAINVSEFFRNPSIWWHLRDKVLPELIKEKGRRLNMWSAGSATGEEAYSLAILAEELKLLCPPYIDAWDIDEEATNIALKGIYHQRQLANVPPNWIDKYFVKIDEEHFKVKDTIRRRVQFKIMNLLNIPFPQNKYDLILCRNVVIYFSAETKKTLYQKFVKALRPGGIMMVGATEHIYDYRSLDLEPLGQFLYRRK
jgi:chemotaxis protein methyltransferase CheR